MDTIHNPTIFSGTRDKLNNICRLCFEVNDKDLIPIFSGDGLEHRIAEKINRYLPAISIKETDELPLKICYHCTSAIISWHQLTETSIQTDIKLKEIIKSSLDNEDIQDSSFFTLDNDTKVVAIPQNFLFRSDSSTSLLEDNDTNNSFSNHFESTEDETPIREEEEVNRFCGKKLFHWKAQERNEHLLFKNTKKHKINDEDDVEQIIIDPLATLISPHNNRKEIKKKKNVRKKGKQSKNSAKNFDSENKLEERFECLECKKEFSCNLNLKRHIKSVHNEKAILEVNWNKCVICDEIFDNVNSYLEHEIKHKQCDKCFKILNSISDCEKHCDKCNRVRSIPANIISFEGGKRYLQCDKCQYRCTEMYRMEQHYRKHTGERPFECFHCEKTSRTKDMLRKHILDVHQGVRKYPCDICQRQFTDRRYMEDHKRIHTGEKPFVCDLCGKCFRQSASLNTHRRLELGIKEISCDLCDKKFLKKSLLVIHQNRKHGFERNFMCNQCGKRFKDSRVLAEHASVHSDLRPFACEICGKTFKLRKILRQHYKVHRKGQMATNVNTTSQNNGDVEFDTQNWQRTVTPSFGLFLSAQKRKKKIKFMNWPKQDENEMNIIDENKEIKVENNVTEEIFIICDNCKILSEKLFENKERKYCEKCFEILVEPKNIDKYVIDIQGETYYECDKCKFKNKSKHILLKHLQRHNNRSFECDKCDRKFVLPYMLAMHKFRKHKLLTNNSENSCKICKQEFDTEEMLYKHETKIHVQCGECFKKFSTSSACEKHITKCKNSRTATIKDKKAPQQSSFQCDQCPYQTKRLYSFEIHYRKHTGEKPFECHECGNTFRIKGSLSMHILDVHQGQRKHVCETCGQSFSVKQNLVNHERLHTGEKPYVCDLCGKTFAQRSGLNTHKRIELGLKTHECKMCNKKFLKRSNLELHNTRKHSDVRSHMCNTCGKLFKDKRALSEHFTVHSDNRPFSCELCGNSFKLRKHLVQHYRVHNKKPIKSTQSDDVCTEEEKMNVQLNTKVEQPFLFIYNTFPQYHQLK